MKKYIFLLCFSAATSVFAQDAHLSQYYASPLTLNPALTGMFSGNNRINFIHRNQWRAVVNEPFVTTMLSYDQPYERFGVGAAIMNNHSGIADLNVLNFVISGSYEVTLDPYYRHRLSTGLQLGFIQKSINPDKLLFDSQYSTLNGGGFDPGISSGESFQNDQTFLPEVNFGIFYRYKDKAKTFNPYFGFSGFHMTSPVETFLGQKEKLPRRFVINAGSEIHLNKLWKIDPNVLWMNQLNNNQLVVGALAWYYLESNKAYLFLGPYYRNGDALHIHVGTLFKEYTIGFSYDVNTSPLRTVSQGRGAYELRFTYTIQKTKYQPSIL